MTIGKLKHQPTVTQKDVADSCGLSVMTVSMALRDHCRNLRPETVARIKEAALELGYDPSKASAARRLRYARSDKNVINNIVGLYFSLRLAESAYFLRLLRGLGEVLDRNGFSLLSNWTPVDQSAPVRLPNVFGRGEVDGVIAVSGVPHIDKIVRMLRSEAGFSDRPIVSLMEEEQGCSCVLTDDFGGGYALMSHLLDCGHREVLCVDFQRWQHEQRRRGFRQACADRGLDPTTSVRLLRYHSEDPQSSRANLAAALVQYPRCRAVFAGNDMTACLIGSWLRADGWRIPQDISLMGFDDSHTFASDAGSNILTTVHVPLEEVARQGATILLDRIYGRMQMDQTVVLPIEIVLRGSTGPPPDV